MSRSGSRSRSRSHSGRSRSPSHSHSSRSRSPNSDDERHDQRMEAAALAPASAEEYLAATRASTSFGARRFRGADNGATSRAASAGGDGDRQWARLMDKVLQNDDSSSSGGGVVSSARPVVGLLRRVLASANFRNYSVRQLDRQFDRAFLIQAIGQYVATNSTRADMAQLLRSMKAQMDTLLAKIFRFALPDAANKTPAPTPKKGRATTPRAQYQVNMFPNAKQSRMFALQYALHKKGAATAAAAAAASPASASASPSRKTSTSSQSSSSSRSSNSKPSASSPASPSAASPFALPPSRLSAVRPAFYISEGSPLFPAMERFCWEMLLPRDSFRVVPTVRIGSGSADVAESDLDVPTYSMDLAALEAQITKDLAAGFVPTAVIATMGSDVQADPSVGGATRTANYQLDDLAGIAAIAKVHGLWIHAEGTGVLLAAADPEKHPELAVYRSLFQLADSVSTEVLGWFDLYGSMALSFFKIDVNASPASTAALAAPATPLSREVVANLFLLWFQLVSHDESFVNTRVEHLLEVAATLRHTLAQRDHLPYPVLAGPTGRDATAGLFPQYAFVQVGPTRGLELADMNLDINSFNGYLFARLSSHVPEPFLARATKHSQEHHHYHHDVSRSRSRSVSRDRSRTPSPARSRTPTPAPADGLRDEATLHDDHEHDHDHDPPAAVDDHLHDDIASDHAGSELSDSVSDDDEASATSGLPLSASKRRAVLMCLSSSFSLSSYQGRLGMLLHTLSSPSCSSSLQATCEVRHVGWFLRALDEEMEWMHRAIELREALERALEATPEFEFIHRDDVVPSASGDGRGGLDAQAVCYGIGAFRYRPEFEVTESQRDQLNETLAGTLSRKNQLYALGHTHEGHAVVVIQSSPLVLRGARAVALLLHEVQVVVSRQRLPDSIVAALGSHVSAGIRLAQERIALDKAPKVLARPTDLLRTIPGVGTVLGWFGGGGAAAASAPAHAFDLDVVSARKK